MKQTNPHNTIGKGQNNRAVNGGADDYFTTSYVADLCVESLMKVVTDKRRPISKQRQHTFVEPSAGAGAFIKSLASNDIATALPTRVVALDINPAEPEIVTDAVRAPIIKGDWMDDAMAQHIPEGAVVFGNPPFGFAASTAIRFFNKAAERNAAVIAFIVPRSFRKVSIQSRLDEYYHLADQFNTPRNAFVMPDGTPYDVPCVWQVWARRKDRRDPPRNLTTDLFTIVRRTSHPDFAVRRVGGKAGQVLDGLAHSASTTYFIKAGEGINPIELRKRFAAIDRSVVDNTAGVRSISIPELTNAVLEVINNDSI
jgi:predicted RNA methylase